MNAKLQIAGVAKETGALLKTYLKDRGLTLVKDSEKVICYGVPTSSPTNINGNCGGGDKIRRMKQMDAGGVRTVPWFQGSEVPEGFKFPALARAIAGHGGTDIVPVFQASEVPWRVEAGWNWFSSHIPTKTEFRVWVWRNELLDVYEKTMQRPWDYKYVGRNFRNGFDFTVNLTYPEAAVEQAKKVIKALSFDFGAVDMLEGLDGKIYVLECNTAPGVLRSGAQSTLGKLADRMATWAKEGTPERGY